VHHRALAEPKTWSEKGRETRNRKVEEGEMLMGETGERKEGGRLYNVLHPKMRKMQTRQICGVRKQGEREGRGGEEYRIARDMDSKHY
jgi:hypothetical protein